EAAMSRPSRFEPPSPMKILAGFQFHGRKPNDTPAVAAAMSGPTFDGSMMPLRNEPKLKMKKATDAKPTMPAANPSRPSMALTAAATITPGRSVDTLQANLSGVTRVVTYSAAPKPRNMATPPRYGAGSLWVGADRSFGCDMTPVRMATHRNRGVSTKVTVTAT